MRSEDYRAAKRSICSTQSLTSDFPDVAFGKATSHTSHRSGGRAVVSNNEIPPVILPLSTTNQLCTRLLRFAACKNNLTPSSASTGISRCYAHMLWGNAKFLWLLRDVSVEWERCVLKKRYWRISMRRLPSNSTPELAMRCKTRLESSSDL